MSPLSAGRVMLRRGKDGHQPLRRRSAHAEDGCALLRVSFGEFRPGRVNRLDAVVNLGRKLSALRVFQSWLRWLL